MCRPPAGGGEHDAQKRSRKNSLISGPRTAAGTAEKNCADGDGEKVREAARLGVVRCIHARRRSALRCKIAEIRYASPWLKMKLDNVITA